MNDTAMNDTATSDTARDAATRDLAARLTERAEVGTDDALALRGVVRTFRAGDGALEVLKGVDLTIRPGEMVALVGPSGAGKSTLLQIAGLLERPDVGSIMVAGTEAGRLDDGGRTALRRRRIGFVYQFHHLLPEFTALENVAVPMMIDGVAPRLARERAADLLERVGLTARQRHHPNRLSGGEQQRVAIARALANQPGLLIADEPTGNLDPRTADGVFEMLTKVTRDRGMAALIATHNHDLAQRMDRILELRDGRVKAAER